eukprot:jgi/Botrbrau1/15120/Bobra.320_1s0004.1
MAADTSKVVETDSAALAAICSGSSEDALKAALSLSPLTWDNATIEQADRDGAVRALLRLFDNPALTIHDVRALQDTVFAAICKSKTGYAQLVRAYSDPDPDLVFAAVVLSKRLLLDEKADQGMMVAGFAPVLLAVLSHASPYCRGAAAITSCAARTGSEPLGALRCAGLVREMMRVVEAGPPTGDHPPPKNAVFASLALCTHAAATGNLGEGPLPDPYEVVCGAVGKLFANVKVIAQEFVALGDTAGAVLRALGRHSREALAPIKLLKLMISEILVVKSESGLSTSHLSETVPAILADLIRSDGNVAVTLEALDVSLPHHDLSAASIRPLTAALVRYIEEGGLGGCLGLGLASCMLLELAILFEDREAFIRSALGKEPQKLVENLARFMLEYESRAVRSRSHELLVNYIQWGGREALLPSAVAGGFIPALLRACKEATACGSQVLLNPAKIDDWDEDDGDQAIIWRGLSLVVESGGGHFTSEALRFGLLGKLASVIPRGAAETRSLALGVVRSLLRDPEAVEQMREAKIWPTLLLGVADHPNPLVAESVEKIYKTASTDPRLAAELESAGAPKRLRASHSHTSALQHLPREAIVPLEDAIDEGATARSPQGAARNQQSGVPDGTMQPLSGQQQQASTPAAAAAAPAGRGPTPQRPGQASLTKPKKKRNSPTSASPAQETMPERLEALAKAWRARGGISAAMTAIRTGSPKDALEAALSLVHLAAAPGGAKELARKGSIRAILLVYDLAKLESDELNALFLSVLEIVVDCRGAAAQLVAALADPDVRVAFPAAVLLIPMLKHPTAGRMLVTAGVGRALVGLLSHASPYCRSAAALAASSAAAHAKVWAALESAGVVPALLRILREGPPQEPPQGPTPLVFTQWELPAPTMAGDEVPAPLQDPRLIACWTLGDIAESVPTIAQAILRDPDSAQALLRLLEDYWETPEAPVILLHALLKVLQEDPGMQAFSQALVAAGFMAHFTRLLSADSNPLASKLLDSLYFVLDALGNGGPKKQDMSYFVRLEQYITAGGEHVGKAACVLVKLHIHRNPLWKVHIEGADPADTKKLVEALSRSMIQSDGFAAVCSHLIIAGYMHMGDSDAVLVAAMAAGFVPGVFRLLRGKESNAEEWRNVADWGIWLQLSDVVKSGHPQYAMQALRCGLLAEMKSAVRKGTDELLVVILQVLIGLVRYPEAFPRMQEADVWPSLFLELAENRSLAVLRRFHGLLDTLSTDNAPRADELLAAGVLNKLKRSLENMDMAGVDPEEAQELRDQYRIYEAEHAPPVGCVAGGQQGRGSRQGPATQGLLHQSGQSAAAREKGGTSPRENAASSGSPGRGNRTGSSKGEDGGPPVEKETQKLLEAVRSEDEPRIQSAAAPAGRGPKPQQQEEAARTKPKEKRNSPSSASRPPEPIHERVEALAKAWRARGGVSAAMTAIRTGCPKEALEAALSLGHLAAGPGAAKELARKGSIRAILLVFDSAKLESDELEALSISVLKIMVVCRGAAAQLVAALADPDARVAFPVALLSIRTLKHPIAGPLLVTAGVGRALVGLLSHASPYCRSAAALAANYTVDDAKVSAVLESAGVVPALMRNLREVSPQEPPQGPTPLVFTQWSLPAVDVSGEEFSALLHDPRLVACMALGTIVGSVPTAPLAIARAPGSAQALLQLLEDYWENPQAPVVLLNFLLQGFEEGPGLRAFARVLDAAGFLGHFTRLLSADNNLLAGPVLDSLNILIKTLGKDLQQWQVSYFIRLEQYITAGGSHVKLAVNVLGQLQIHCKPLFKVHMEQVDPAETKKLVEALSRSMIQSDGPGAVRSHLVITGYMRMGNIHTVLVDAMAAGFVPGVFRLLKGLESNAEEWGYVSDSGVIMWSQLSHVMELGRAQYAMQALRCGLLAEMKSAVRNGMGELLVVILQVLIGLVQYPEAFLRMQEADVWPSLLLELAESRSLAVLRCFYVLLDTVSTFDAPRADELLAAGVLTRLKHSLENMDMAGVDPEEAQELRNAYRRYESEHAHPVGCVAGEQPSRGSRQRPATQGLLHKSGQSAAAREKGGTSPRPDAGSSGSLGRGKGKGSSKEEGPDASSPVEKETQKLLESVRSEDGPRRLRPEREAQELGVPLRAGSQANGGREAGGAVDGGAKTARRKKDSACAACGIAGGGSMKLWECSKCKAVQYCGRDCQAAHWPAHKLVCKPKTARSAV